MNRHDFFPTGESAAVPGGVIPLHQVLGSELGMVIDTNDAGIEGACLDLTGCSPALEFISPTIYPGRTSTVMFHMGPMWSPLSLG